MATTAGLFISVAPDAGGDGMQSDCKMLGSFADIGMGLLMSMAKDADFELLVRTVVDFMDSQKGIDLKKDLRQ